jgi:hypothetical protein
MRFGEEGHDTGLERIKKDLGVGKEVVEAHGLVVHKVG